MLQAGIARTVITPPVGTDMTGYLSRTNPSIGILDGLWAKALVLSLSGTRVALITVDIVGLSGQDIDEIRQRISDKTGISDVMISCLHTHSGPATMKLPGLGKINPDYFFILKDKLVQLVVDASTKSIPVRLSIGRGLVRVGVNRRSPDGPVDPDVSVLRFDTSDGHPVCLIVNYSTHPVVLGSDNRKFSRDYPGFTVDLLEENLGCMTMFLTGAVGDINPQRTGLKPVEAAYEEARRIGMIVGAEALKASLTAKPVEEDDLSMTTVKLKVPIRILAPEEQTVNDDLGWGFLFKKAMEEWVRDIQLLPTDPWLDAEVCRLDLGDAVICGVPGEIFCQTGLDIKSLFPGKTVLVSGYTNGNIGYIFTREAFEQGGYEVDLAYRFYGQRGPFTADAEDILKQAIISTVPSGYNHN